MKTADDYIRELKTYYNLCDCAAIEELADELKRNGNPLIADYVRYCADAIRCAYKYRYTPDKCSLYQACEKIRIFYC